MSYKNILDRADAFFRSVNASQSQHLQCGRGCSLCCYGLFEIGSGDIPILAEGLGELHPMRRRMIVRKAVEIVASSKHPNLRECSPTDKDEFFDRTKSTACPNLNDAGECMIYDHRPLVPHIRPPAPRSQPLSRRRLRVEFHRCERRRAHVRRVGSSVGRRNRTGRPVHNPGSDRSHRANARMDVIRFTFSAEAES